MCNDYMETLIRHPAKRLIMGFIRVLITDAITTPPFLKATSLVDMILEVITNVERDKFQSWPCLRENRTRYRQTDFIFIFFCILEFSTIQQASSSPRISNRSSPFANGVLTCWKSLKQPGKSFTVHLLFHSKGRRQTVAR